MTSDVPLESLCSLYLLMVLGGMLFCFRLLLASEACFDASSE